MTKCEGCGVPIEEHIEKNNWCEQSKSKQADTTSLPFGTSLNLSCDWCEPKQELIRDGRYKNGLGCPHCGKDYGKDEVPQKAESFDMELASSLLAAQTIVAHRHREEVIKVFKEMLELKGLLKK